MLNFINTSYIVFYNEPSNIYIRIFTKNKSDLIQFEKFFNNIFNSPNLNFLTFNNNNNSIVSVSFLGNIEKSEEYYRYTIKSFKYIAFFIIFVKNNIINVKLNKKLNSFVYKLYLNWEFEEYKWITFYSFCFLKNKIYFDKKLLLEEKNMIWRENKRIKRIWKNRKRTVLGKKKEDIKIYFSLAFEKIQFENNSLNFSNPSVFKGWILNSIN